MMHEKKSRKLASQLRSGVVQEEKSCVAESLIHELKDLWTTVDALEVELAPYDAWKDK